MISIDMERWIQTFFEQWGPSDFCDAPYESELSFHDGDYLSSEFGRLHDAYVLFSDRDTHCKTLAAHLPKLEACCMTSKTRVLNVELRWTVSVAVFWMPAHAVWRLWHVFSIRTTRWTTSAARLLKLEAHCTTYKTCLLNLELYNTCDAPSKSERSLHDVCDSRTSLDACHATFVTRLLKLDSCCTTSVTVFWIWSLVARSVRDATTHD